ncbi:PLDc N-terminal domain-containing protein [Herbiconiux solani]|uniref:PLDc N-terminal domain-containing protein n=1 Tax=Herbiconiux solani TaxID=661329 RepID=UPI000826B532|nr:PLDc N-terminal domain-containing protein [Herbiconiux solani]
MFGEFNFGHVIVLLLILASVVLWIAALVSIVRADRLTATERVIWILVVIIIPLIGSIGWFAFGRPRRSASS